MEQERHVPHIVISRLPVYLRALKHMEAEGKTITSSKELAARLGVTPAQIRKDLSYFGEFGRQGMGYKVEFLRGQLQRILKVDREWPVVLVGAGDLGHALAHYDGFASEGFRIVAVFDKDPAKVGQKMAGLEIQDSADLARAVRRLGVKIAIIAVPASGAQEVANQLVAGGVEAVLNYAPVTLSLPEEISVQYVDPVVHLQRMTYYVGGE